MWTRKNTITDNISNVSTKPQLAGFLLTGNRSNFLYVEGSTAWLYDCPHYLSPLCISDQCFDKIPIYYKDTVMYVHPITRQLF